MIYAVIPVKGFQEAKQRLATFLQPHERQALARAMLTDTLTACMQARGLDGIGVVTRDAEAAALVRDLGVEVLWEPQAQGHSQAVAFGVQLCRQRGITTMLTLPGDLPLLTAQDVQAVIAPPDPQGAVVLVPNRDNLGTNAMLLSPPDCLPLAFGHDSFQRHLQLAAERHLTVEVRRLPRVAVDIDEPDDLALFAAQQATGQSGQMLVTLGLLARLAAAYPLQTYERVS
ncbi:MAG: 2-phospho-L-lactate guanylyltransferase [Candidatus Tectomicrobia bacterium]|uniref:2-phospho-L-lactate guanylyltransferase n=1 Tax=Tectimicrobiota bacterium TaxID=2528274 RepID=A0A937VZW3_UNCTE|nr:2-phospho-L-lactate guanylyltransferase [Candidatus Tectomicrobia bacterium]